jgi:hypothetical protein
MEMNDANPDSFSARHRWSGWLNLACATAAVLLLAGVLNYLSHRHHARAEWAGDSNRTLSPRTKQLLSQVTNEVQVIIFYDQDESIFPMVENMLQQYVHLNRNLKLSSVNPLKQPKDAERILQTYHLSPQQLNVVIFSANNQHQIVPHAQLTQTEQRRQAPGESGHPGGAIHFERTAFWGERMFTSALQAVTTRDFPVVYWVTGHGEKSIISSASDGYLKFGKLLGEMNVKIRELDLKNETVPAVPDNCQLLILAGPRTGLTQKEQRKIHQYLTNGGRMLITLHQEARADLDHLLYRWGLRVGDLTVDDPENRMGDGSLSLDAYEPHPVVQALQRGKLSVRMLQPRPIMPLPEYQTAAAGLKVNQLILTSPEAVAYRNPGLRQIKEAEGTFCLAAAVEKVPLKGVQSDHHTRLVVISDSDFLDNLMFDRDGNRELAWHSVNWLLARPLMMQGIGPRPIHTYRFEFRSNEFWKMAGLLVGVMPAGTLFLGLMIWLRRRT